MPTPNILFLSKNWLIVVSIYYFITCILGLVATVLTVIDPSVSTNSLIPLIVGGIGMSLVGSSIYYIRKVYRACLRDGLDLLAENETFVKRLGTLIYLLARPLFGVVFAVLVVVGMKAGIVTVTKGDVETSEGYFFVTLLFCFFAGFAAGRILNMLDQKSELIARTIGD